MYVDITATDFYVISISSCQFNTLQLHYTTRIHWHLTPAHTQHDLLWPWPWPLPFLGSKNSKANVLFSDCLYCLVCFQDGLATLVQRKCGFSEYRDGPVHDDRRDAWTSCCSVLHDEAVLWQGHNGHRDGTGAEILCSCLSWSWTMSHAAMWQSIVKLTGDNSDNVPGDSGDDS